MLLTCLKVQSQNVPGETEVIHRNLNLSNFASGLNVIRNPLNAKEKYGLQNCSVQLCNLIALSVMY